MRRKYGVHMTQRHPVQNLQLMFVTTNTRYREPIFSDQAFAREAVESLYRVQCFHLFFLYAFVIMPDHCHFLLHATEHDAISRLMYSYKRAVCFEIGRPIWQPRFYLQIVHGNANRVIRYIHANPVRKNLCDDPCLYPWSSASGRWDTADLAYV